MQTLLGKLLIGDNTNLLRGIVTNNQQREDGFPGFRLSHFCSTSLFFLAKAFFAEAIVRLNINEE